MKKLIITTMALSLMAAPAFAFGSDGLSTSGQMGMNGNAANKIRINGNTGYISNNGAYSTNFGSLNTGPVANITNFSSSYIEAPTIGLTPTDQTLLAQPPSGDLSLTTVSSAAVGATTVYESGFKPEITTLAVDYDDRSRVKVNAIVVLVDD